MRFEPADSLDPFDDVVGIEPRSFLAQSSLRLATISAGPIGALPRWVRCHSSEFPHSLERVILVNVSIFRDSNGAVQMCRWTFVQRRGWSFPAAYAADS